MARWKEENFKRSKGMGNSAANLGTSCHGALEPFVIATRPELGGSMDLWKMDILEMMFRKSYMDTFKTSDPSGDLYDDGMEMLARWFKRQCWEGVTVLSCEIKENFKVKTSAGEIPFNFIWDRHDLIGENEYKIVDYKTNRWGLRPEDLKKKIQARCYGLAAQIKYPQAERIWVEFDLLRHDPVGIVYSREENIATWKFIKELSEKIINTPEDDAPETLNPECRFCVRKLSCGALQRNIASGGVYKIGSAEEAVDLRATLDFQAKAVAAAIAELDEIILTDARRRDILEFESDMNKLTIGVSGRRSIDPERVKTVIGNDLFERYAGASITMGNIDKLLRGSELNDTQKKQLKGMIFTKRGEPSVKVEAKNSMDGDL